jgi:hypothetical protein
MDAKINGAKDTTERDKLSDNDNDGDKDKKEESILGEHK